MTDLNDTAPVEHVIARLRPRAYVLVFPAIILMADSAAAGYLFGRLDLWWQALLLWGVVTFVAVFLTLFPMLAWLSRRYTITTRRVILQRGLFVRVRQELLHTRGYDITLSRSWLQAMLGAGDVGINSGLSQSVWLRSVPDSRLVQRLLQDLAESNRSFVADRRRAFDARPPDAGRPDATTAWGVR